MELKFDPRFRVIGKYLSQIDSQYRVNIHVNSNWLSISSQYDSNILQLLGILGRILVPPATQLFRSNDSIFSLSVPTKPTSPMPKFSPKLFIFMRVHWLPTSMVWWMELKTADIAFVGRITWANPLCFLSCFASYLQLQLFEKN